MARMPLPPGFRFHPTDVELIMYYLKRKVMGKQFHYFEAIAELDIYKFGPWDLPDKSLQKSKDLEWYFFCPKKKKYASGARTNRATDYGYWKTTGKDRSVTYKQKTVGMIKTLVFHNGHAPKGQRTDWVMYEYRIEDENLADVVQEYMLCKIFQKSGLGPKNGAQYGAPFNEEEWSDVEELCSESSPVDGRALYHVLPSDMNNSAAVSLTVPGSSISHSISEPGPSTAGPSNFDMSNDMVDLAEEDIGALLDILTEDSTMLLVENSIAEKFNIANNGKNIETLPCLDGNEMYNDLQNLNWAELMDTGFNLSTYQDVGYAQNPMLLGDGSAFLELNDLDIPLRCHAEAGEFEPVQTGSTYAPQTSYRNLDGSYCEGNYTSAVQNVSELNQHSALPEGSHWLGDNLEVARRDNGFGSFEAHGVDTFPCNEVPVSYMQESSFAEQIQRRGEQEAKPLPRLQLLLESISAQPASAAELHAHLIRAEKLNDSISYCGSSIHFKAEVTQKVGECTKDALSHCLSHCLGESTCMCIYWGKLPIGDLRKNVTCVFYFVVIWIFMHATVQFFVDMMIMVDNCCLVFG